MTQILRRLIKKAPEDRRLVEAVRRAVAKDPGRSARDYAQRLGNDHSEVVNALRSLSADSDVFYSGGTWWPVEDV